jgi:LEA14-like dessication related protein
VRKAVYLVVLMLLCSGCTLLVKTPVVTVRDFKVTSLDGAGAGMELNLTVQNANPYDLRLLGYSYDLKVMALQLAKGETREEVTFAAGSATELRIPVQVSYGDLLQIFKGKPDPEHIPYTLLAHLDLQTPLGRLALPVNRTGTYAVPKQYRPAALLNKLSDFLNQNR